MLDWREQAKKLAPTVCKLGVCGAAFAVVGPFASAFLAYCLTTEEAKQLGAAGAELGKALVQNLNGLVTNLATTHVEGVQSKEFGGPLQRLFCRALQLTLQRCGPEMPADADLFRQWDKALEGLPALPALVQAAGFQFNAETDIVSASWPQLRRLLDDLLGKGPRLMSEETVRVLEPLFRKHATIAWNEALAEPAHAVAWRLVEQDAFRRLERLIHEQKSIAPDLKLALDEVRTHLTGQLGEIIHALTDQRHQLDRMEAKIDRLLPPIPSGGSMASGPQTRTAGDPFFLPRLGVFVGRALEVLAAVDKIRQRETKEMINLSGPPGVGKTELAKAAVRSYLQLYPEDQAIFVDLRGVGSVDEYFAACAQALGIEQKDWENAPAALAQVAAERRTIVCLDNFESVAVGLAESGAAIGFAGELAEARNVRVVLTCREGLVGVASASPIHRLDSEAGAEAFVQHARKSDPECGLVISEALTKFVRDRLSGHALSIALVAPRYPFHGSLEALVAAWEEGATELARVRPGSEHGKDWSLLVSLDLSWRAVAGTPRALEVWMMMAVLSGGLSEALWKRLFGEPTESAAWRAARERLQEGHLIEREAGRWTMLEPIREYLLEQGQGTGRDGVTVEAACRRALDSFDRWSGEAEPNTAFEARIGLRDEFPNLSAVFRRANAGLEARHMLRIGQRLTNALTLAPVSGWAVASRVKEVAGAHGTALDLASAASNLGRLAMRMGRPEEARECFDEALKLFRASGSFVGEANTHFNLGQLALQLNRNEEARTCFREARSLFRQSSSPLGEANTLAGLGQLAFHTGRNEEARTHFEEALPLFRQSLSPLGEANTRHSLGRLANRLGQSMEARVHFEEALRLYKSMEDPVGLTVTYADLARCDAAVEDAESARSHLRRAAEWAEHSGSPQMISYVRDAVNEVAPELLAEFE